jgi:hypothetical protein
MKSRRSFKMINRSMEEALKRAQKKATDADTDPEAYRDRVLSAARQAMNSAKTDSIEIDHERGKVVFSLDRSSDKVRMFIDGDEIPEERMTDTIADIDGIGKAETVADKAQKAIEATGITRNLGARSFDAVLRTATNQAKEANKSASSLLRAILMMMGRTVDAR